MATQALLKSSCYDPRGQDTVQHTKAGLPYYDGNPFDFEQWHFVVMQKYDAYASKKDVEVQTQDLIELSVKVIEGLKDDALKCAMDHFPEGVCVTSTTTEKFLPRSLDA